MSRAPLAFRAVIFDMDGVLVDSEPAFYEAANRVLAEEGQHIEWERYQRLLGTSVRETWRALITMLGLRGGLQSYLDRYDGVLLACLGEPRTPLPGVLHLLNELKSRSIPCALATSSRKAWMDTLLQASEIPLHTLSAFAWRELVAESKPAPDLYLHAAELLGVPPERCIAIEDTPTGIASAKAAGMYTVHVRASSTAFPPIEDADLVLESLAEFPIEMLG